MLGEELLLESALAKGGIGIRRIPTVISLAAAWLTGSGSISEMTPGVIYDNKMGKPDDSYAGTEIGGSIKAHKAKWLAMTIQ